MSSGGFYRRMMMQYYSLLIDYASPGVKKSFIFL